MILVVLAVGILRVMYVLRRYRWKFGTCLNRFHERPFSSGVEDEHVYERDAFICFNSKDRAWVCNDLLQHMEEHEISTVIHHRDFLPGSILEESIRESIDKCRFTVLVLSPDFLSSNWCLLEMYLARSRIISQGRDVIVPIILREFPTSQLTRTLEGILSRSYLEWTGDPEGLTWSGPATQKVLPGVDRRPRRSYLEWTGHPEGLTWSGPATQKVLPGVDRPPRRSYLEWTGDPEGLTWSGPATQKVLPGVDRPPKRSYLEWTGHPEGLTWSGRPPRRSYLEWTGHPEGQTLLWNKLKHGGNIRPLNK